MDTSEIMERKILKLSFVAGLTFAVIELAAAILISSQSMLMDAAYDATELVVIALTLFLTPLFHKPLSEKRPFGYKQVESVFIVIKNFMMISVTVGLLGDTLQIMLNGGKKVDGGFVSVFQIILGMLSVVILVIIKRMNISVTSDLVRLEIYSWKIDTLYSFGMAVAFLGSMLFEGSFLEPVIPYFDQIVAIFIVIFMIPQALKMLSSSLKNMFLFSPDEETVSEIKEISLTALENFDYKFSACDTYRTGSVLWADIYVIPLEENISVSDFSKACKILQAGIWEKFPECSAQIILREKTEGD
ncbi:MAG: cation transporter [Oscillospiraceae bacterium]